MNKLAKTTKVQNKLTKNETNTRDHQISETFNKQDTQNQQKA